MAKNISADEWELLLIRPTRLVRNLKNMFYSDAAIQWFKVEVFRLADLITL